MKKGTSLRIESLQLKQLDWLVGYYKVDEQAKPNSKFNVRVSRASVIELLIKEKYQSLTLNRN